MPADQLTVLACLRQLATATTLGLVRTRYQPLGEGQALRTLAQHTLLALNQEQTDLSQARKQAWLHVVLRINQVLSQSSLHQLLEADEEGRSHGLDGQDPYVTVLQRVADRAWNLLEEEQADILAQAHADAMDELVAASRLLDVALDNAQAWGAGGGGGFEPSLTGSEG